MIQSTQNTCKVRDDSIHTIVLTEILKCIWKTGVCRHVQIYVDGTHACACEQTHTQFRTSHVCVCTRSFTLNFSLTHTQIIAGIEEDGWKRYHCDDKIYPLPGLNVPWSIGNGIPIREELIRLFELAIKQAADDPERKYSKYADTYRCVTRWSLQNFFQYELTYPLDLLDKPCSHLHSCTHAHIHTHVQGNACTSCSRVPRKWCVYRYDIMYYAVYLYKMSLFTVLNSVPS